MLRGEVGARALRVRSVSREEVWASAGVQVRVACAVSVERGGMGVRRHCLIPLVKLRQITAQISQESFHRETFHLPQWELTLGEAVKFFCQQLKCPKENPFCPQSWAE